MTDRRNLLPDQSFSRHYSNRATTRLELVTSACGSIDPNPSSFNLMDIPVRMSQALANPVEQCPKANLLDASISRPAPNLSQG